MDDRIRQELRSLSRAARILALNGHEELTLGHVAYRDPEGRGIWIKQQGLGLGDIRTENDYLLVGWDGEVLFGDGRRHIEWPLHSEIMIARPDLHFSVHSHPRWATLLTATDELLPDINQEAMRVNAMGVGRFEDIADLVRTREEGAAVARALGTGRFVLLRNHGVSFFAESAPMLGLSGVYLERAAQAFLTLRAAGVGIRAPAPEEIRHVVGALSSDAFVADNWAFLERMLNRAEAAA